MRVVILGGTGHVGTYLVPRLVNAGHDVVCVSRELRTAYQNHVRLAGSPRICTMADRQ